MILINNELIYDAEDTPKVFDLLDWKYLIPVIKAISIKITDVEQRGIYGNEPRRFALTVSEALTEQEITDVLAAWTNFSPLNCHKLKKIEQLSELSYAKSQQLCDSRTMDRALAGYYDRPGVLNVPQIGGIALSQVNACLTIDAFRVEYYRVKALIEAATSVEDIDAEFATANFPTALAVE